VIPAAAKKIVTMFEGCSLEPYEDVAGNWTVGVGHLIPKDQPIRTISQQEADDLLTVDLASAHDDVKRLVTVPLTDNQLSALISFVFNLGATAFAKSTMLKKLNAGDYLGACQEFPKWSNAGGVRVQGLYRRRISEQALFAKP
jgi:lysozyme